MSNTRTDNLVSLKMRARNLRRHVLRMAERVGQGYVGQGLGIADLLADGAPIDSFGVGTRMAVSQDAPTIDMAYKLVQYVGQPRVKLSSHKEIYPGRKQVFRVEHEGRALRDLIARSDERGEGRPLLVLVMQGGRRLAAPRGDSASAKTTRSSALRMGRCGERGERFPTRNT